MMNINMINLDDECREAGVHLTSVDEDGYCNFCGESPSDEDLDDDSGVQGGVIVVGRGVTLADLPMGGCATSEEHEAHLAAGKDCPQ